MGRVILICTLRDFWDPDSRGGKNTKENQREREKKKKREKRDISGVTWQQAGLPQPRCHRGWGAQGGGRRWQEGHCHPGSGFARRGASKEESEGRKSPCFCRSAAVPGGFGDEFSSKRGFSCLLSFLAGKGEGRDPQERSDRSAEGRGMGRGWSWRGKLQLGQEERRGSTHGCSSSGATRLSLLRELLPVLGGS